MPFPCADAQEVTCPGRHCSRHNKDALSPTLVALDHVLRVHQRYVLSEGASQTPDFLCRKTPVDMSLFTQLHILKQRIAVKMTVKINYDINAMITLLVHSLTTLIYNSCKHDDLFHGQQRRIQTTSLQSSLGSREI